jgi:MFS family permease
LYSLTFLASIGVGLLLGSYAGLFIGSIVYRLVSDTFLVNIGTDYWALTFSWLGAIGLALRFVVGHRRFFDLLKLKRKHRMIFYRVRRYSFVPDSFTVDFIWAYLYTIVEAAAIVAAVLAVLTIVTRLLFPYLWYFAFFVAIYISIFAWGLTAHFIYSLFAPLRLEGEVGDAGNIIDILMNDDDDDDDHHTSRKGKGRRW